MEVSLLMRMWRLWAGVWDGELPRADYVRMRIAVGLMWVAVYATLVPNMTMLFDGELGLPLATMRGRYGGNHIAWFDGIHGWQVPALVYGGMAAAGLFTVGVLPRVAGVVAYLIHLGLQHRCFTWMDGSDDLARMLLAFMLLAPLGRRSATLPAWPLRLCQLQVAVMYLATAAWKAAGSDWPGGTALYWALSDPRWQRLNLDLVLSSQLGQLGLSLATLGTLVVEFAMPVLLLWPRTRRAAVLLGLALHLGILATMRVGLFTPMVMASYAAFWTGPWWPPRRWLVQAWRDLRAPRSTPSSQASPRAMS